MTQITKNNEEEFHSKVNVHLCDRTIYLFDTIDEYSTAEVFKFLQVLETDNSKKPIKIILNSVGGDVYAGLALFDRIKISPCKIITVGTGLIASMALIIFLAGKERVITPNAVLLNHQASMTANGRTADIKIEAAEISRLEKIMLNIISTITCQPIKKLKLEIDKGDYYITAATALTCGYATSMVQYEK